MRFLPTSIVISMLARSAFASDTPAVQPIEGGFIPDVASVTTAAAILASQPRSLVAQLAKDNIVVLQEVREEGPLSGGNITSYVMFGPPVDNVYRMLSQSARQVEFRPELTSIETVEMGARGPIDEQRMKILFQRYVYRIEYRLDPERRRIEWVLDERFENDLKKVSGFWELYATEDGRTLGRSGTSIDVGAHVPAFLQDWITRKNLPKTMERVRLWVNSGGEFRP